MNLKLILVLLSAMMAVSTAPLLARWLDAVPAVIISFWRMAIAAAILWTISGFRQQGKMEIPNRKKTILAGVFLGLHFLSYFGAIKLTTIANATFLATCAPVFTIIVEKIWYKRRLNKYILLGLMGALAGELVIIGGGLELASSNTPGNLMALSSAVFFAGAFLIAGDVRLTTGTIIYTRTLYTSAAFTILLIALVTREPLFSYTLSNILGLVLLGIIPTIFGHSTLYYAVKYVPPTVVAAVPLGEPVLASVFAWILFRENVSWNVIVGGFLILAGVYVITQYSSRVRAAGSDT